MRNVITLGIMAIVSILLIVPRSRRAICKSVDGEMLDKAYELKNVLSDFKKNRRDMSY